MSGIQELYCTLKRVMAKRMLADRAEKWHQLKPGTITHDILLALRPEVEGGSSLQELSYLLKEDPIVIQMWLEWLFSLHKVWPIGESNWCLGEIGEMYVNRHR